MGKKKKLLICGATGFVGRNLTKYFASRRDFDVFAVYNRRPTFPCPNVTWLRADLTRLEDVSRALKNVDILIQAAATTSGVNDIVNRPHIHVTDNAVMNSLIFRSAHDIGVNHLIFFSCSVMYQSSSTPVKEEDFDASIPMNPKYFPSGWTKVYIEKQAEFFAGLGNTKYTILRHSNVYGPHDKFDLKRGHIFGATIAKVLNPNNQTVTVWGNGEEARDLLYINDLTNCVERSINCQTAPFGLFNVGIGKATTVKSLVKTIVELSGRNMDIVYDETKPTIKTRISLNSQRANQELGWSASTEIDEGIIQTIQWYRENILQ